MLFGEYTDETNGGNLTYWLANKSCTLYDYFVMYNVRGIKDGWVGGKEFWYSNGTCEYKENYNRGVRAVVSLAANIQLED